MGLEMFERLPQLSYRRRVIVLFATTFICLSLVNVQIAGKEKIVRDGTTVLLRIAPRDPRSLLQGDYMALRYSLANDVASAAMDAQVADGRAVIELQGNGEAHFVAIYDDQQIAEGQQLLRFRKRGESVRLASDAFFFEEGQGELYSGARFGELRVDQDGDAVLTGLLDDNGDRMGSALH
jgi:uncharacterized membrane-anchored protein